MAAGPSRPTARALPATTPPRPALAPRLIALATCPPPLCDVSRLKRTLVLPPPGTGRSHAANGSAARPTRPFGFACPQGWQTAHPWRRLPARPTARARFPLSRQTAPLKRRPARPTCLPALPVRGITPVCATPWPAHFQPAAAPTSAAPRAFCLHQRPRATRNPIFSPPATAAVLCSAAAPLRNTAAVEKQLSG